MSSDAAIQALVLEIFSKFFRQNATAMPFCFNYEKNGKFLDITSLQVLAFILINFIAKVNDSFSRFSLSHFFFQDNPILFKRASDCLILLLLYKRTIKTLQCRVFWRSSCSNWSKFNFFHAGYQLISENWFYLLCSKLKMHSCDKPEYNSLLKQVITINSS